MQINIQKGLNKNTLQTINPCTLQGIHRRASKQKQWANRANRIHRAMADSVFLCLEKQASIHQNLSSIYTCVFSGLCFPLKQNKTKQFNPLDLKIFFKIKKASVFPWKLGHRKRRKIAGGKNGLALRSSSTDILLILTRELPDIDTFKLFWHSAHSALRTLVLVQVGLFLDEHDISECRCSGALQEVTWERINNRC